MTETIQGTAVAVPDATASEPAPIAIRSAFDVTPRDFKRALERRKKNRDALMEWIRESLVEGADFGRLHVVKKDVCNKGRHCDNDYHFSKPSLWKSGAEKIHGMLGLRAHWPELEAEVEALKKGQKLIVLRCILLDQAGNTVAEGVGGRSLDQDYGDINKAIKMAKKSGLIDAVLNAGGLSEIFTQDVEDMDPELVAQGNPDPMQPAQDRIDTAIPRSKRYPLETHCPIGREWKNTPWDQVEDSFLYWIVNNIDDKPDLAARAKRALADRSVDSQERVARRAEARKNPGKKLADWARDLTMAKSYDELVAITDDLPPEFEPSLRKYIQTRGNELGAPQSTRA